MNTFQTIILIGLAGNAFVGLLVLFANPVRRLNRYFLCTTMLIVYWLICMFAITLQSSVTLLFWTRQVSSAAVFLPIGFFVLRFVILHPEITVFQLCYKMRYILVAAGLIVGLCQTRFFVHATYFSTSQETVPFSEYGFGFYLYILYFIAMVFGMGVSARNTFKVSSGVQRTESQFLLLGWLFSFSLGLTLFTLAIISDKQEVTRFLPLFSLIMNSVVAYGIATRRILAVSTVVQRAIACFLMAISLIAVYAVAVWIGQAAVNPWVQNSIYFSHLFAALVVAFSVIPARGWMQKASHLLFPSAHQLNVNDLLERAGQISHEVSTEDNLIHRFSELIETTFGTTRVVLLRLGQAGGYDQVYPQSEDIQEVFHEKSHLIQLLQSDHEPYTVEILQRMRPVPHVVGALHEMETSGASLAVGSYIRKQMKIVLLLSSKKSKRIYDLNDQRALQLLCDQMAVAIENSALYTAVQDGKIYNEILLDSLTSGVVAVNSVRRVTVFNQLAQALTGLPESSVVNQNMMALPPVLADGLELILSTQSEFRDQDMSVELNGQMVPLRVSGAVFCSHTGSLLGALLVFNDMTLVKKMEEQIRRTDRLSSIGTLSAGMAHEIKNPLVTIKTFTQLLPQQFGDADFRSTFFELVDQEVQRIDTIVNRLLNFARPAKASLRRVDLHQAIENAFC